MCTKRTLLGASKNRAWSLRPEKVDLAVPYKVVAIKHRKIQLPGLRCRVSRGGLERLKRGGATRGPRPCGVV